jgi:hypothetical protein
MKEKIMKLFFYLFIFFYFFSSFLMVGMFNQYKGESITAQNLVALSKQDLDPNIEQQIYEWFDKNPDIVRHVVQQEGPLTSFKERREYNNKLLDQAGVIKYNSANNYIFSIPDIEKKYVIEISGFYSRFINTMVGFKKNRRPNGNTPPEELNELREEYNILKDSIPTYQTASRVATSLRLQEAIGRDYYWYVHPIKSHLLTLPGFPPDSDDKHSIVIAEYVNMTPLSEFQPDKALQFLSSEDLKQILSVAKTSGLWELNAQNICVDAQGSIRLPDTEQPDNSNPEDFYHKNEDKVWWNIGCGVESLYSWLPENSEQRAIVRQFIVANEDYKKSRKYPELVTLFKEKP